MISMSRFFAATRYLIIDLISQGAGIALPIAALGLFVGLRAWASRQDSERDMLRGDKDHDDEALS